MVVLMLANVFAGISPVEAARSTGSSLGKAASSSSTLACPTDATAIVSYSVKIKRGGSTFEAGNNLSQVQPGDTVTVTFDLDDDCSNYRVSLVSYKAADDSNNLDSLPQRVVSSQHSTLFGKLGGSLTVTVPNCYHATIFAVGSVLTYMSPAAVYGARAVDTKNGGTFACSGIGEPRPYYYVEGNQNCAWLGAIYDQEWDEFKIDGMARNGTYELVPNNPAYTLTIYNSNNANTFSWSTQGLALRGVFVKASTGGNFYPYIAGSYGGTNLKSVGKANGGMYDISHVSFCYTPLPSTPVCPEGKTALNIYRFEITRGANKFTATDMNNVQVGDLVKAYFDLAPGCDNIRLSLPAYEAATSYYDINLVDKQKYKPYAGDTGLFSATQPSSERYVQTLVPSCNFQANFVYGDIIVNMSANNLYGDRKIAWKHGGTTECEWAITPTSTSTANATQTKNAENTATRQAEQTGTSVSMTQTAIAPPTQTSVSKTQTSVAKTATVGAQQTETSVAKTSTASANQTGTAVGATQTSVAQTATVGAEQTGTAVAAPTKTVEAQQTGTSAALTQTALPVLTQTEVAKVTQTAWANQTATTSANQTGTVVAGPTKTVEAQQTATTGAQQTATTGAQQTATVMTGQTETAVSITETVVAGQTETAASKTETASAQQTGTADAATGTAVSGTQTAEAYVTETAGAIETQTAIANQPGSLAIHKVDESNLDLFGACFWIFSPADGYMEVFIELCDNDGLDVDDREGWLQVDGLAPAQYLVIESQAPVGYEGSSQEYYVTVNPGNVAGIGTTTVMNTFVAPPGGTTVYMYKLVCDANPGYVNAFEVSIGNLPEGCSLGEDQTNWTFNILNDDGEVFTSVTVGPGGTTQFHVAPTTQGITVVETSVDNPLLVFPPPDGVFEDIHCPCGNSDIVIVNLRDHNAIATATAQAGSGEE
jgi:hypothetical protein